MKKVFSLASFLLLCIAMISFPPPVRAEPGNLPLSFTPADAVLSEDGGALYLADKAGKTVYRIDTETFAQTSVSFDLMPEALYYADGKLFVTLCEQAHSPYWWTKDQSGAFAILNANDLTLIAQHPIALDPYSIVVSNDGTVYIGGGSGQWTEMHTYTQDGALREKLTSFDYQTKLRYNAQLNRIYGIDTTSSPQSMFAFPLKEDGTFVTPYYFAHKWPYHGDYGMGSTFHVAPDGKHVLGSVGNVFVCQADHTDDMKFKISLNKSWTALAFSEDGTQFYTALGNKQIYAYSYATFEGIATYESQGYPKYLFSTGDMLLAVSTQTPDAASCFIETVALDAPKSTIETTVTVRDLTLEAGRALLGATSNAKTVFNGRAMYIVDSAKNALFAIDTVALTETKVTFPDTPTALYYHDGELFVGFGGRGVVAILDAETFAVKDKLVPGTLFQDMAVGTDGYIYVVESQLGAARSYSRATGQQVSSVGVFRSNGKLVPHPTRNMFYWADIWISPQDINAFTYADGIIGSYYDSPYHGTHPIGARIRISPDGNSIFTSSGSVFVSDGTRENDMKYKNAFLSFADLVFDLPNGQMYLSGVGANLYVYDDETYAQRGFVKTVSPVKEMALHGTNILALSVENNTLFYLEILDATDIRPVTPEAINVATGDVIFLKSGASTYLAPTLSYNDGTSKSIADTAVYASTNEAVAVVGAKGRLEAIAQGYTKITVSASGITKDIDVYVDFDLSSITVEGYELDFSTAWTEYYITLPSGTTEAPAVTYEAPEGVLVQVTDAAVIPGATTLVVTDSGGNFSKTYTISFRTAVAPPVGGDQSPYLIGFIADASDGFIHLDLFILRNVNYEGNMPLHYTVVIQLFTLDLEPVSMTAVMDTSWIQQSFSDQYIVTVAVIDQFGHTDYIGVPLAMPVTFMM